MLRLSKILIALPLVALPLSGLAERAGAEAMMTQLDALRLLAKSRAADGKCKILPTAEADELNGYLARAEIAAASRHSVSEAQSTIALGKALGDTVSCTAATSGEVGATLAAARQAMAAVKQPRRAEADAETNSGESPAPRPAERAPESRRSASLADYGRQAFAYYVERRCEYLSRRDIRAFWTAIVRQHKAALGAYGGPAVARMLKRVRAQAKEIDCDASGRQLVRSAYTKLARN
ncbi:MAG: hypothetical protein AB7S59_12980 [Parvibaculaceae bacterium]